MGEEEVFGQPYELSVNLQGIRDTLRVKLLIVSEDNPDLRSKVFDLNKNSRRSPVRRDDPTAAGTQFQVEIDLPKGFKPGAMLLQKYEEDNPDQESPPFVATVELKPTDETSKQIDYPAYSYIDVHQGQRVVFPAHKAYPGFAGQTPAGLQPYREEELLLLRGKGVDLTKPRDGAERVYEYQVYNDLGVAEDLNRKRPVLGGAEYKYPRRLKTNRKLIGEDEERTPGNDLPWIPLDERFNNEKNHAFSGDTNDTAGKVVRTILGTPRGLSFALSMIPFIKQMHDNNVDPKQPRTVFTDLCIVDSIFDGLTGEEQNGSHPFRDLLPVTRLKTIQLLDILEQQWKHMDTGLRRALRLNEQEGLLKAVIEKKKKEAVAAGQFTWFGLLGQLWNANAMILHSHLQKKKEAAAAGHWTWLGFFEHAWNTVAHRRAEKDIASVEKESLGNRVDDAVALIRGLLEKWPVPRVREGRAIQWKSDEEFGRAALAGQNPLSIRAATTVDLKATLVKDADVKNLMEGKTLEEARKASLLWVLDYTEPYKAFMQRVEDMNSSSVQYSGRCFLYTREATKITVPVAVEVETIDRPMRVFTANDTAEIWLLAKLVIASLDSGVHQLVQHWLRTHACVEPYIIASRRQLSAMNPLYKLLEPHFRYTMRINCNARKVLINAGGIVERAFTPGPYCMRLSAVVYDDWKFKEQSFPNDLVARGLAEKKPDGDLDIKLPHYYYAQDGKLIWDAIHEFAGGYLSLFYDDNVKGKRVTEDVEIQKWWEEIQLEGHPDTDPKDWPAIDSVAALQDIAASMMWTASCHHAAVNFGQYDNSAYMPYKPSVINRKIPEKGSPAEKELRNRYERNLLETLTDPVATIFVMITVKILSAHGTDEEYLDKDVHNYIKDAGGKAVHKKFVARLKAAQKTIEERNTTEDRLQNGQGLPYTLMIPGKPAVLQEFPSGRLPASGIPYSISI